MVSNDGVMMNTSELWWVTERDGETEKTRRVEARVQKPSEIILVPL
jgi:hypothetical protein